MREWIFAFPTFLLLLRPALGRVEQHKIDQVSQGKRTEARASWWGFDAEDATSCLQAAIDSSVPRLIVEDMGSPWIVKPLTLVSNQEILFEKGVELLAKRGEYKGSNDCLVTARGVENIVLTGHGATFRMWKEDYQDPNQYSRAEWRHCLSLRGATGIEVVGLTFKESGGDGIYLGCGPQGQTNLNIMIKDVICDDNHRQGISVITAENLWIENTILRNTRGTAPQAGIDFEPNLPQERLVNVVMRNCLTENNASSGYFFYLRPLNAESEPVSIRLEHCRSVGDGGHGARVVTHETLEGGVRGSIEFVDCVFESSGNAAISVSKPSTSCRVRFENCRVLDAALDMSKISPIMLESRLGADTEVGGLLLDQVWIQDPLDRHPMGYNDQAGGMALRDISGTLHRLKDGQSTSVTLTDELLAEWMPFVEIKNIPRLPIDIRTLVPLAVDPGQARTEPASWPMVRKAGTFLLYAEENDKVSFTIDHQQVGSYSGREMRVIVITPSETEVVRTIAPFQEETFLEFIATETGIHRISLDATPNRFQIRQASNPMALLLPAGGVNLIHSQGSFSFYVPPGTIEFGVRVAGQGPAEAIRARLIDPKGEQFDEVDDQFQLHQFEVELPQPSAGEVWTLRIDRPSSLTWEDHYVDLRGVPPLLSAAGTTLLAPIR